MIIKRMKFERIDYIFAAPDNYEKGGKHPVIILLHGAGTRGTDLDTLEQNPLFKQSVAHCPDAVIFAPLCMENSWFNIFERLQDFALYASLQIFSDANRVYLMGVSMGGYGAWALAMARPEIFAAVVPICGGGMAWNGATLKSMAVWAFHGKEDRDVYTEESIHMVERINSCGGNAKLTLYDGVGHNCWDLALSDDELYDWLYEQRLTLPAKADEQFGGNPEIYG